MFIGKRRAEANEEKRLEGQRQRHIEAWRVRLLREGERALDDFDELLKAGFGAADFAQAPLREIFGQLAERVDALGYGLGARQSEQAALAAVAPDATKIGGRLLVYELLQVNAQVREHILQGAPSDALRQAGLLGGHSLWHNGLRLVLQGRTSRDELERVVGGQAPLTP